MLKTLRFATAALWLVCSVLLLVPDAWLSFWKTHVPEEAGLGYDHLIMFAALGLMSELSRRKQTPYFLLCVLCFYGLGTETAQHFIPGRHCDLLDLCQDCTGAFFGGFFGIIAKKLLPRGKGESSTKE